MMWAFIFEALKFCAYIFNHLKLGYPKLCHIPYVTSSLGQKELITSLLKFSKNS